jgi:hypothetical protein
MVDEPYTAVVGFIAPRRAWILMVAKFAKVSDTA